MDTVGPHRERLLAYESLRRVLEVQRVVQRDRAHRAAVTAIVLAGLGPLAVGIVHRLAPAVAASFAVRVLLCAVPSGCAIVHNFCLHRRVVYLDSVWSHSGMSEELTPARIGRDVAAGVDYPVLQEAVERVASQRPWEHRLPPAIDYMEEHPLASHVRALKGWRNGGTITWWLY